MTSKAKFKFDSSFIPNALSVLRGIMAFGVPPLLFSSSKTLHLLAFVVFVIAALTDYYDGALARKYGGVSDLGKILDPTMDKVLTLVTMIAFAKLGYYSIWWVVPVFIREFVVTFCRIGFYLEGTAVGAEKLGKVKLVVQVVLLASAFSFQMIDDYPRLEFLTPAATFLLYGLWIATVFLTLISGATFFKVNRHLFKSPFFAKYLSATGVGLIPLSPGTLGSIFGLAMIPFLSWNTPLYIAVFVAWMFVGLWAVKRLDLSVEHDPQFVVIDEVVGMLLTMFLIPLSGKTLLIGFLLFRFFDIVKPFPCRRLEKLPGFWGITCDDLMAGLYSWLILFFFFR